MITHCPSCHTHFRVHAEQLAVRAGQVRCGKCSRVFNALEHLIEEIAPVHSPWPVPELEPPHADSVAAGNPPEPALSPATDAVRDELAPEVTKPADLMAEANGAGVETPEAPMPKLELTEPATLAPEARSGAGSFNFGPTVKAEAVKPGRRWPWLVGALLLLLMLLAQAVYQYRSAIVLLFPQAKPYAAALCANLGCDLPLPRRIELLSIEASDLQADTTNPNVMVLSATLKNRAIFNQQHPLLELTLTDAQDQPVVRRVLAPQDYLGKAVNVQAGFAANADIAIKMFIEGSQVKATGYRLYLFYP